MQLNQELHSEWLLRTSENSEGRQLNSANMLELQPVASWTRSRQSSGLSVRLLFWPLGGKPS